MGQVPFFNGLSQEDFEQVNGLFNERGYAPNETIYFAGDGVEHLFVVADGRVKLMHHSLSGKDVLLDILTPGEFFGSFSIRGDEVHPDTAQALTQSCVLGISVKDFHSILEKNPPVVLKVLDITAARLQAANERVQQLSAMPVEGRIASLLLVLSAKFGEQSDVGMLIQAPLARDDVAAMTGTEDVRSELLPEDKLVVIRELQQERHVVAMVGDGINDAPELAAADISIAMGAAGTDIAIETADIALMADDLMKLPEAIRLSKATLYNIHQNVLLALATVSILLIGVLMGRVNMAGGMLIHEASVLIVILNGMRLLRA